MTTTATQPTTDIVAIPRPQRLAELLRTVALFAGTDDHLPVLETVRVSSDGKTITALSTDRYACAHATFTDAEPHQPFSTLLVAKPLVAALKATVTARSALLQLTPNQDGTVTFSDFETSFTVPTYADGEWPQTADPAHPKTVWPTGDPRRDLPFGAFGVSTHNLTRLAKLSKKGGLRFRFYSDQPDKAFLVEPYGETDLRVLVMPYRLAAEDTQP